MYSDGFGHHFHPKAANISVRDLIRCYPYVTEKNSELIILKVKISLVNHGRQGKWMDRKGKSLKIKTCEGVLGQAFKKPRRELSPQTERRKKFSVQTASDIDVPNECLPAYPAWKGQIYSISHSFLAI